MSAKENFSQAVKDLLTTSEEVASKSESGFAEPSAPAQAQPVILRPSGNTPVYQRAAAAVDTTPVGVSTIAAGTVIVGEIHSKGDLNIFGDIQGNIETHGNVSMGGKVIGNIEGKDVNFSKSSVKGNIIASGTVTLDGKSVVLGDVNSKSISCNGRLKGNLTIDGKAHFLNETILVGNVCAGSLVIEEGARIKGDVSTSSQNNADMEDPFKDL
ncbi:MAG: polymer-forming cytoskeletal protein [Ruthenibacterium sp.]